MTKKALLGLCLISTFSFALGVTITELRIRRQDPFELPIVATVNGENLSAADLRVALSPYRRAAIEDLVAQRLLLQAAQKQGLHLDPEASPTPQAGVFPDEALAVARQARSDRIRRELCLLGVPEEGRRRVFEDLGPELRRYNVIVITLKDVDELPFLQREIANGASFESLVSKYTTQVGLPENGQLSEVSRSTVSQFLGPYVGDALLLLKPGQVSAPVPSPFGPVVVKLISVKQSYDELKTTLDDVLVESEALALDYRLGSQAYVTSPYVPELAKKSTIKDVKPLKLDSLKPIASRGPSWLPQLKGAPVRKLAGLALKNPPTPKPTAANLPIPTRIPVRPSSQPTPIGILKATIEKISHRVLVGSLRQKPVLRLDVNDNHNADDFEPVLVCVTDHGWQPVSSLDHSIDREVMEHDFGYWSDRAVFALKGKWWEGHVLVKRPLNARIEADEVRLDKLQPLDYENHHFEIGAEIQKDDSGRLFQNEQRAHYSRNTEVDKQDLLRLSDYFDSDANWTVPHR